MDRGVEPRIWLDDPIAIEPVCSTVSAAATLAMIDRPAYGEATAMPDVPLGTLTSQACGWATGADAGDVDHGRTDRRRNPNRLA